MYSYYQSSNVLLASYASLVLLSIENNHLFYSKV